MKNPILWADFPDPDPIRVGDTYYMATTTMHVFPGCAILRSYDLLHWELASYVFDTLDNTPAQRLQDNRHIYGQGMWAASLRWYEGRFYVCFVANDTHQTYLYTAGRIEGPWTRQAIEGFYHDCSLLFDDDGRVFLIYGNAEIHLTELKADLSGPKPGGLDRIIVTETQPFLLGYEGAHFYKIHGRYYATFIHIAKSGHVRRTQACFVADSPEGEFVGGEIFDDDMGYFNSGVAQGGFVDTPEGKWFAILFQDHGAVGRIPFLVPMDWKDGMPVLGVDGKTPQVIELPSNRPGYVYRPLVGSDDFCYAPDGQGRVCLKDFWQWNHIPDNSLWSVTDKPGALRIRSGKRSPNLTFAANTLTQRAMGPGSEVTVTLNGAGLQVGDFAGVCLLISTYGLIALTREAGRYILVMLARDARESSMMENLIDELPGTEYGRVVLDSDTVQLKAVGHFVDNRDECAFFYRDGGQWKPLGIPHKMHYKLDHFMGCRFGLFLFSTQQTGGVAEFSDFRYTLNED